MNRTLSRLALLSALTVLTAALALPAGAQEKKETNKKPTLPTVTAPAKPGNQRIPFRGKIEGVDKTAMTIKVGARTFQATSATRITKNGKPGTFDDATVGEEVGGQYTKAVDGKLELQLLRIGAKPEVKTEKKVKEVTK